MQQYRLKYKQKVLFCKKLPFTMGKKSYQRRFRCLLALLFP